MANPNVKKSKYENAFKAVRSLTVKGRKKQVKIPEGVSARCYMNRLAAAFTRKGIWDEAPDGYRISRKVGVDSRGSNVVFFSLTEK